MAAIFATVTLANSMIERSREEQCRGSLIVLPVRGCDVKHKQRLILSHCRQQHRQDKDIGNELD